MVRKHDTNNNPWIRVNDFAQHRDTSGSAKPYRDFIYATRGERQKKNDETEALAVNAVRSCETDEKQVKHQQQTARTHNRDH
ncbi:hypothetical protein OIU85_009382 [Salix viminalis]|uniref:Uncharacterized protein n=1 Tax=Salix viminalis TaxID=40686 RepID=A0A9Q0NUG8_SALVM|nr:hypothetical protein OIU85_009382 [Salix viminalis]